MLPERELGVDERDGLLDVDVSRDQDGHVIGHVVGVVELVHSLEGRVLQMLDRAQGSVPVRVGLVELLGDGFADHSSLVVHRAVFLFVDGLQFGLEEAKDRLVEAFGLDFCPLLQTIGGEVDLVNRFLQPGVGVEAFFAHGGVEAVEFAGNGVAGSELVFCVDFRVDLGALFRVGLDKVLFVERLDAVEVLLFLFVVQGAELVRALEEHVFHIVGHAGGLLGIVLAAGADGDFGVEARFLVVFGQVDGQAIVELVDVSLHGIGRVRSLDQRVFGLTGKGDEQEPQGGEQEKAGFASHGEFLSGCG